MQQMTRGDECERGPLSSDEKERWRKEIDLFCSKEDPEFVPDFSGGMVFIREGERWFEYYDKETIAQKCMHRLQLELVTQSMLLGCFTSFLRFVFLCKVLKCLRIW